MKVQLKVLAAERISRLLLITAGAVLILLGQGMSDHYERALQNRPDDIRLALWVTPQAEIMPSVGLEPGLPARSVHLDEFKRVVGNQPYQVFYDQALKNGGMASGTFGSYGWGSVIYQSQVAFNDGTKAYLLAREVIPHRYDRDEGWRFNTSLNEKGTGFISSATYFKSNEGYLGWILKVVGLVFSIGGFLSLFLPRRNKTKPTEPAY